MDAFVGDVRAARLGARGRRLRTATITILLAALLLAAPAGAKEFDRLVVVGAQGRWTSLAPRPGVVGLLFEGAGGERPARGGYLRLFPLFHGFPGLPARYYPATGASCSSLPLQEPARFTTCPAIAGRLARLLRGAGDLPRFQRPPTVPVEVRYHGRRVRLGNLNTGLELAFARRGRPGAVPLDCFRLAVRWRGPLAGRRPERVDLCRTGTYARGRRFLLAPSLWRWARLNLRGGNAPVYGSRGPDVLRGTARRDGLHGRAGADRLLGFAGNDSLYGGDGADVLFGHVGNDRFFGRRGRDLVYAGPGKDWAGGGLGDDRVLGGGGDDVLFGGPGEDHLSGGFGSDHVFGNAGNDFINSRDGHPDVIDCGGDVDVVVADRGDRFLSKSACEVVMRRFDRRGISFLYPASWFVTTAPLSNVRDPDYRFALATWPVHPAGDRGPLLPGIAAQRPADGAFAFLGESIGVSRRHALRRLPPRPRHFRLPTRRDGDFLGLGKGSLSYQFKDSGRAFMLGISIGPRASAATRHVLSQLLDGLNVRPLASGRSSGSR